MAAMMAARDDEMDDDPSDRMEEEGSHAGSFAPSEAPPANISTYEAPRDTLADARARAAMTVVIQPGSSVLRIGRASDPSPCIVPHVIARLCTGAAAEEAATRKIPETEGDVAERQREIAEVERGMKRWSGPTRGPTKGGAGNPSLGVEEEVVESSDAFEFLGFSPGNMAATYVGADALKVSCAAREDGARYVVRSPMRRGRLVQRASPQEQISDLVAIWEHAIRDVVGLSRTEVTGMACVLVVPANVCKTDTKLLVDLVINELRFRSILIVQDASCAAFQANAHTACVVDIGATKTSVTAVEDGLCMPSSCFLLG
ncbi:actin-domain-containing protein, partial [Baffinella frigidus]